MHPVSLHKGTCSPEPSLLALTKHGLIKLIWTAIHEYLKNDFFPFNDNFRLLLHWLTTLVAYIANNMDPGQTAPAGVV